MKADGIKPRKNKIRENYSEKSERSCFEGGNGWSTEQSSESMDPRNGRLLGHIHKDISSEATGLVESSVSSSCAEQGLTLERKRQTDVRAAGDIHGDLLAKIRERRLPSSRQRHASSPEPGPQNTGLQAQGRESCQESGVI